MTTKVEPTGEDSLFSKEVLDRQHEFGLWATGKKPTVEKWESRYNKYMADCWDDHIRTFPQADTREWNSGFDMAQGLAEDFIHSIIKKSAQEAKAEMVEIINRRRQPDIRCGYCGECRLLPETGMCWRFINNQLLDDLLASLKQEEVQNES